MKLVLILIALAATILLPVSHINNQPSAPVMETKKQVTEPTVAELPNTTAAVVTTPESVVEQVQEITRKGCDLAYNYDWPQDIAYAICMAESTGNQDARNMSDNHGSCVGSYGLWQVGCFWYYYYGYSDSDFYNPDVNVSIAYQIYKRQGSFNAWTTFTRGSYLKYL